MNTCLKNSPITSVANWQIIDATINLICKRLINENLVGLENLRFAQVKTVQEWQEVINLRLRVYGKTIPYMLNEMSEGVDAYESRSLVYAAWQHDRAIATIRITPYPFEILNYLDEQQLAEFLGQNYQQQYVEWTRLLVDPEARLAKLMPALIIYAGIKVLTTTSYSKYVGYTKLLIRRLMQRFHIAKDTMDFYIPQRNNNRYQLLKGDFGNDFWYLMENKFLF